MRFAGYLKLGTNNDFQECFVWMIFLEPLDVVMKLAQALFSDGNTAAQDELLILAGFTPTNPDSLLGRRDAITIYEQTLAENPQDFKAYSTLILAYIKTECVTQASRGSIGNDSGINTLRGPGVNNWDISLFKKFKYGESPNHYIQLRMEAYNAFNHTNFAGFNSTAQINPATGQVVNAPAQIGREGFGALTSVRGVGALGGPRIISLAAKLYF